MKPNRTVILLKFGGKCAYCGEDLKGVFQIDHCVPQSRFYELVKSKSRHVPAFLSHLTPEDVHHIDNLMPSCQSCNNYKASMTVEAFREEIKLLLKRLAQQQSIYRIAKRFALVYETNTEVIFYYEKYNKDHEKQQNNT